MHIIVASYFECYGQNLQTALQLPVKTLHLDLVRCPSQLDDILKTGIEKTTLNLSLGIVDGRNIWKNDFTQSLAIINKAVKALGRERILLAPSCSLLHVPCDLDLETNEKNLSPEIKNWMSFAKQKIDEVVALAQLSAEAPSEIALKKLEQNKQAIESRNTSSIIHKQHIKDRVKTLTDKDAQRLHAFTERKQKQKAALGLPLFTTTTIGSFPQTTEVRNWRAKWKKGELTNEEYDKLIKTEIE